MKPKRFIEHMSSIMFHPLSQDNPWAAVVRYARWQLGSRLLQAPVVVPFTDQAKLVVKTGMTGATCNIYTGLHDFPEMAFTAHLLRRGDHFVDVGANVGVYTVLAGAVAGADCIAFEPATQTFKALESNMAVNKLSADLRCAAVGASNGTVRFSEDRLDTTSHIAIGEENGVEVEMVTLDASLPEVPTLLKIDVEGFEGAVLDGAERTLGSPELLAVIMETNGSGDRYGGGDDVLLNRMVEFGFRKYSYAPFERKLIPAIDDKNTIFVKDVARVSERLMTATAFSVRGRSI